MAERVAMITGGTGALGAAVVKRLLAQGVRCHVTWHAKEELEDFEFGDRVQLHQVDCTSEDQVKRVYRSLDRLDASLHLVGGFAMAPTDETHPEDLLRMFQLNAVSCFLCCREAIRRMRRNAGGRIVNVSARPAVAPTGGMVAYTSAKAAVASMTQCLADETRQDGILINAILPSIMDTPQNRLAMPDANHERWPKVEQVAKTVAFLAGPDNELSSGALVPVYGLE